MLLFLSTPDPTVYVLQYRLELSAIDLKLLIMNGFGSLAEMVFSVSIGSVAFKLQVSCKINILLLTNLVSFNSRAEAVNCEAATPESSTSVLSSCTSFGFPKKCGSQ